MTPATRRLERLPAVVARTGMSRSWVYAEAAAGRFPKPIKIGSASRWDAAAVDYWLETMIASGTGASSSEVC